MALNARRNRQLLECAAPLLLEGEQVELTSLAGVGSVSARRQALTAAAVGVLSAGTVMATVTPRPLYVVLTDRRLLFFDGNRGGRPGGLVLNLPRPYVSAGGSKKAFLGLQYVTHLSVSGQEKALKVTFPVQHRADGPRFVSGLPVTR
ncbi:hypothetical protein QFZ66_005192 [Streptomyces sp. B4I13]|uniref:Uncharacterized protein n=1 Tax=Streptomyces achromogenes TaxID=67255 RepID=A0ABU0Q0Y8_STRAH|nr:MULTISPECIES: hypothetical protein [Streptomyces]MDQ0684312.1 hypothetical protein [Streptomyces achromogenes]MDQ0831467.1 hypothetical protein [Streptomyces achromogenes]MDQ0961314.1 hypothetical protein [Streptomyces sp. B4I13]